MKQLLWNLMKLLWACVMPIGIGGYVLGTLSAKASIIWISVCSVVLAGIYGFLSAYRLGPGEYQGEFLGESEIAEFNPNQWLFRAWCIFSLSIVVPAYQLKPHFAIVIPTLLVLALVIVISLASIFGRQICRLKRNGRYSWIFRLLGISRNNLSGI